MIKLAVIADDLTGANDTAVQFAKHHIRSCVKMDFDQEALNQEDNDVVVIDTDSRDIAADLANRRVREVCELLKSNGVVNIYKKVDSTLRGNLGAEIEAVAEVFSSEVVIIAPAFPSNRRTTIGGYHLLDCIPIELTEIAYAPKSPVKESRVVELLKKQTGAKIGLIPLYIIIKGEAAIKAAIKRHLAERTKWLVFDTATDEDLRAIVNAARGYKKILWVGSAGLADCLPQVYEWSPYHADEVEDKNGKVLIISGSVSKITQRQIAEVLTLDNVGLVKLDIAAMFDNREAEVSRCVTSVKEFAEQDKHVVLAGCIGDEDVEAAIKSGGIHGMGNAEVSERMACVLAEISKALTDVKWAGMVLTGGDTAIHVCRALAAGAIDVLAEVAVGIPLGRLRGGVCNGLRVITKAGAFGEKDSFVRAIQAIQSESEG